MELKPMDLSGKEMDFYTYLHTDKSNVKEEKITIQVYEGDTSNYWQDTATNALRPLCQLLTMAKTRPDGVWDGD